MGKPAGTLVEDVEYPSSDGKPMAETDLHRKLMNEVIEVLSGHFADDPDVYVSGNLLVYYERGNPRKHLSPDCFVVRGLKAGDRDLYCVWEEGRFPDVVLEMTSLTTRGEDTGEKFQIYQDVWKVREYILFDPREEYLTPSLRGYRLADGVYQPIPISHDQLTSEVLGSGSNGKEFGWYSGNRRQAASSSGRTRNGYDRSVSNGN